VGELASTSLDEVAASLPLQNLVVYTCKSRSFLQFQGFSEGQMAPAAGAAAAARAAAPACAVPDLRSCSDGLFDYCHKQEK
jgi:hypothetical protein